MLTTKSLLGGKDATIAKFTGRPKSAPAPQVEDVWPDPPVGTPDKYLKAYRHLQQEGRIVSVGLWLWGPIAGMNS